MRFRRSDPTPKIRCGQLTQSSVQDFFKKRLNRPRMQHKSQKWETLDTKDRVHILAESLARSKAAFFHPDLLLSIVIPLAKQHPEKFASGLGKTNTRFFFKGLDSYTAIFFVELGQNVEKFVKRIYYKDQLAFGVNPNLLAKGIAGNLDCFIAGMGNEGLLRFDSALSQSHKKGPFLIGLRNLKGLYEEAVENAQKS